jgi:hypothetical protein
MKIRILGISTTNANDKVAPRESTSGYALDYSKNEFGAETMMINLRDLHLKHCEGYYSKKMLKHAYFHVRSLSWIKKIK